MAATLDILYGLGKIIIVCDRVYREVWLKQFIKLIFQVLPKRGQ